MDKPALDAEFLAKLREYVDKHYEPEEPFDFGVPVQNMMVCEPQKSYLFVPLKKAKKYAVSEECDSAFEYDINGYIKQNTGKNFSQKLLSFMAQKGVEKASTLYTAAFSSRQIWSNIMNKDGYKPKKETAICYAMALKLNMDETDELLRSAGYCLANSDKRDLVVMYFINNGHYDIADVDWTLKDMNLRQLVDV